MAYTNEALGKALEDLTVAYNHFLTKAKDEAMVAIGDTVIAQIKQDAKEHIASELTEQKNALTQAIEQAKIVLHNSAIEGDATLKQTAEVQKQELAALITAAENTIKNKLTLASQEINDKITESVQQHVNTAVNTIVKGNIDTAINETLIKIFQNGYIQWPGMPKPDTLFNFEGYRWVEVDYNGCFFRAKGKDANSFNAGEQGDAIRNIRGEIEQWGGRGGPKYVRGAFSEVLKHNNLTPMEFYGEGYKSIQEYVFSASYVVPTAEENRPRNKTFIIWKLEKL